VAIKPKIKEVKKFMTVIDVLNDTRIRDEIKTVLWGPRYKNLIEEWKNGLMEKMRESEKISPKKYELYEFIYENFESIPIVAHSLRNEIMKILSIAIEDFNTSFANCDNDYKCETQTVDKYLDELLLKLRERKGKSRMIVNEDQYKMILKYIEMSRIFSRFKLKLRNVYESDMKLREEKRKEIEMQRLELERKRKSKSKMTEMIEDFSEIKMSKSLKRK
jgi:hypothetical protein